MRALVVGAGYFAQHQIEAWSRIADVEIVGIVDQNLDRATEYGRLFGGHAFADVIDAIEQTRPDFLDLVTPPETHLELVLEAAARRINVICQKPIAPTLEESRQVVATAGRAGVRFMVHENWRWQPWYRVTRALLDDGTLGEPFSLTFTMRTGDGWQADAYMGRQPYFREYERLLLYETGVHFLDTFRFLLGEAKQVYATTQQRNTEIAGEDSALVNLIFESGAIATLDASRFNEVDVDDPRFTFGSMRLDCSNGHIELDGEGNLDWKPLGAPTTRVLRSPTRQGFGGDSVFALQTHFVECVRSGQPFESEGADYLRTLELVDACYRSADSNGVVQV